MLNSVWYESIPTFKNQPSRTLDSFSPNEKYEDDFFPPTSDSLIPFELYQKIINGNNREDIGDAEHLNSIGLWRRISECFPNYNLFPPNYIVTLLVKVT